MQVTEIRFSYASSKKKYGVCGFCMIVLDGSLIINRVAISRNEKGQYQVHMPNIKKDNRKHDIVSFKQRELEQHIKDAILAEFNRLTRNNNGEYKYVKK